MSKTYAMNRKLLGKMNDASTFLMTACKYGAYQESVVNQIYKMNKDCKAAAAMVDTSGSERIYRPFTPTKYDMCKNECMMYLFDDQSEECFKSTCSTKRFQDGTRAANASVYQHSLIQLLAYLMSLRKFRYQINYIQNKETVYHFRKKN